MTDCEQLTALLHELRVLAAQAKQRGDLRHAGDLLPEYWYGVQFSFEDAAERLETALKEGT